MYPEYKDGRIYLNVDGQKIECSSDTEAYELMDEIRQTWL